MVQKFPYATVIIYVILVLFFIVVNKTTKINQVIKPNECFIARQKYLSIISCAFIPLSALGLRFSALGIRFYVCI